MIKVFHYLADKAVTKNVVKKGAKFNIYQLQAAGLK